MESTVFNTFNIYHNGTFEWESTEGASVGYHSAGNYVSRATIAAASAQRIMRRVSFRFNASQIYDDSLNPNKYVHFVCQISTGANDYVNAVGPQGSSVGRVSGYMRGSSKSWDTVEFTFDESITLESSTTYYLWFYPYSSSELGNGRAIDVNLWYDEVTTPMSVSISASPYNTNSTVNSWGVYLQNYSKASITVTATGTNQSAITNCTTYIGSTQVWSSTALSGLSPTITGSGSIVIRTTVTDATGATGTASMTITVEAYQTPNLTNITSYRCNSSGTASTSGTELWFSGTPSFSSVGGRNTNTVSFKYGQSGGSMGSYTTITNPSTWQRIVSGLSTTISYVVTFRIVDTLGNSREFTTTIPTEAVTMNLKDGGTSVCFGGYATQDNCFEIANSQGWKAIISNGMYGDSLPSSGTEGQIFFKSITNSSGSANIDYAIYNSVTDVGLTSGSATIVSAAAAMPMNSYLICPANEFDATSVPSHYGHIEILIPGAVTRMSVLFRGKELSNGDYRMFVNSSGVPDGTWHKITMS